MSSAPGEATSTRHPHRRRSIQITAKLHLRLQVLQTEDEAREPKEDIENFEILFPCWLLNGNYEEEEEPRMCSRCKVKFGLVHKRNDGVKCGLESGDVCK